MHQGKSHRSSLTTERHRTERRSTLVRDIHVADHHRQKFLFFGGEGVAVTPGSIPFGSDPDGL